jgi:predicted RNA-binding Zn-ribbon protein involved in translation (DUF1610 family)
MTLRAFCPFFDDENRVCKARIYRVVYGKVGKRVEYEPLTESEAKKCASWIFRKCPVYLDSGKNVCPNCGHDYPPEEAVKLTINGETVSACPQCGSTRWRR